jgi:hypothetical protein
MYFVEKKLAQLKFGKKKNNTNKKFTHKVIIQKLPLSTTFLS